MMTTAGGDGLSFLIGTPNIFDLVEALVEGKDLLEGPKKDDGDDKDGDNMSDTAHTEGTSEMEDEDEEV